MREFLKEEFAKRFDNDQCRIFHSPGRVNLIGEHLDYNGGMVLPAAITLGINFAIALRDDHQVNMVSLDMSDERSNFSLDNLKEDSKHWTIYPKSAIKLLQDKGYQINQGFDILIFGNLPNGGGLSSSAALLDGMLFMLSECFHLDLERLQIAKFAQEIENNYLGLSSGIMDQFAIAFGKEDHAIALQTDTLEFEYVPLHLKDTEIVIIDSKKSRELRSSDYNLRREECEQALVEAKKKFDIQTLAELDHEKVDQIDFSKENYEKRARFVSEENKRSNESVKFLKQGDLKAFGRLMNESHEGLRNLFEVTGFELDLLVELARANGAIGSRMTGAGFGGCTVSLLPKDKIDGFEEKVLQEYKKQSGLDAKIYFVQAGDWVKEIK